MQILIHEDKRGITNIYHLGNNLKICFFYLIYTIFHKYLEYFTIMLSINSCLSQIGLTFVQDICFFSYLYKYKHLSIIRIYITFNSKTT